MPEFEPTVENVALVLHVYCAKQVNGFGVSAFGRDVIKDVGSGVYYPANLINHSC
jgi:hypothetical protein